MTSANTLPMTPAITYPSRPITSTGKTTTTPLGAERRQPDAQPHERGQQQPGEHRQGFGRSLGLVVPVLDVDGPLGMPLGSAARFEQAARIRLNRLREGDRHEMQRQDRQAQRQHPGQAHPVHGRLSGRSGARRRFGTASTLVEASRSRAESSGADRPSHGLASPPMQAARLRAGASVLGQRRHGRRSRRGARARERRKGPAHRWARRRFLLRVEHAISAETTSSPVSTGSSGAPSGKADDVGRPVVPEMGPVHRMDCRVVDERDRDRRPGAIVPRRAR